MDEAEKINDMQNEEVMETSDSPWDFPVFLVKKNNWQAFIPHTINWRRKA